jgi:undecaprenyl-diphosphatase
VEYTHALILSIVEGITEFLPISSTGHLILTANLLGIPQTEFVKSFEIIIQLGAILAVALQYFRRIIANPKLILKIGVAFIPAAILGLGLYKIIKSVLIGNSEVVLWSLLIGGIILLILELWYGKQEVKTKELESISYRQAVLIGVGQSISLIPGISRAGATIAAGMLQKISRPAAVEFSFLLAIPTMMAATVLDLSQVGWSFSSQEYQLLAVGLIGSFISAWIAVRWLVKFVAGHNFVGFGIYRIIIAIIGLLFWL